MDIANLGKAADPFADAGDPFGDSKAKEEAPEAQKDLIHIRVQQRNGRKCITTVQGIDPKFDLKAIVKVIKKQTSCNGTIVDDEGGQVMQFQGDQRDSVMNFLVENEIAEKSKIKKHGHG